MKKTIRPDLLRLDTGPYTAPQSDRMMQRVFDIMKKQPPLARQTVDETTPMPR
jgi:hypothetical protein